MRAVNEHDASVLFAGGSEGGGALGDLVALGGGTVGRGGGGVDEHFVDGGQAVALGEGPHF